MRTYAVKVEAFPSEGYPSIFAFPRGSPAGANQLSVALCRSSFSSHGDFPHPLPRIVEYLSSYTSLSLSSRIRMVTTVMPVVAYSKLHVYISLCMSIHVYISMCL